MVVASLEVSTSSAKCVVFSSTDGVVADIAIPFPRTIASGPYQNPDGIVMAAIDVLSSAVQAVDALGVEIEAIALTGTWHSLLLLDKDRRPLGNIMTWADLQAASSVEPLRSDPEFVADFSQTTGCMVHAMYPVWKWVHLRRREPQLANQAAFLSSQIEYVFEAFTGCGAVSKCTASGTGFFNINSLDWDDEILDYAGIARLQLNPLQEAFYQAPLSQAVANTIGSPSGIPVFIGCADGAMNQVAVGGARQGVMSLSVGTSGALRVVCDEPKVPAIPSTWCYYLFGGKRISGAATNNATNCVDWLLARMGARIHDSCTYQEFATEAALADIGGAPYFMPFVFGERCPGWREDRAGGFVGVRASHSKYDMYYAVLEGVVFNLYQCYEILAGINGVPEKIVVSGGILNSREWMQMAADVFGRELYATGASNDSTIGAALLALEALGDSRSIESCSSPLAQRFVPRDEVRKVYEKRYAHYLELYSLLE